jgi:AcrR family transcriptional regulator
MATSMTLTRAVPGPVVSPTIRRLLLAGVECFWRDGFHASSTRDIAKRAKLSPAAVYVHFAAKEDLLFTIIVAVAENLRDRLRELAAQGGSPTELLSRLLHAYVALPARMYKASLRRQPRVQLAHRGAAQGDREDPRRA